jgi:hypothetical protein
LKRLGQLLADTPAARFSSSSNAPTSIVPDATKP